ncbi:MAG: acyl-CoA dehydrogenase family protein [Thermobispora bispora]|nr:acyl-CoA dehydrogenase family protein [Thermobispora bispora]
MHLPDLGAVRLTEELTALRQKVRDFIVDELAAGRFTPRCDAWLTAADPEFSRRLGRRGWLGMTFPPEYGGTGAGALARFVVTEELLAAGAPVAAHWIADRQSGPQILRFGTEEQKRAYLPGICRGETFFAIGMSEPDSGSDLASVRTRARRVDGGWRVTGTKVWTSGAHYAHAMIALVRTGAGAEDRHAGLSQFIIDLDSPGVQINPIRLISGAHHFNEVVLDDVFVPDTRVLGEVGNGWRQVTGELAWERSGPERFLSTYPLLAAAVDHLADRAGEGDLARIGALVARLWTLRRMSIAVASRLQAGRSPEIEAALVKDLGTRFEQTLADTVRLLARVEPDPEAACPLPRLLAEAVLQMPGFTLRGGTNEILRGVVAKGLGVR